MDHETEVAAPKAPAVPEVDERIAAFKRGAPLPKAASPAPKAASPAPRTEAPEAPSVPEAPRPPRPPRARPAPKPKPERTDDAPEADAASADERAEGSSDTASGGTTSSGARRRRRGGRGRGGGTRPSESSTSTDSETGDDDEMSDRPVTARVRAADPTDFDDGADVTESSGSSESAEGGPSGAPRKRRRRGGRGRGRGGAGGAASREMDDSVDTSPEQQTAESQRDDAAPDEPTSPKAQPARRRSGTKPASKPGSGRSGSGRSGNGNGDDDGPKQAKDGQRSRGAKAKQMTAEEQVAAGGPTRSIRGSRNRTGRDGRRRREPAIVPPRFTDKLMIITERGERDQIAVLDEDVLVHHYVTRQGATSMVGNVYLGRVQNVLPGMEAAFVDIGRGRNGVLYAGEVNYRPEDLEGPAPRIENVLKSGQAVMVQVTKDPMGGKGARLTAQISLPGRYLVLAPDQDLSGISRRLGDTERKRLKSILKKLQPSGHGVIVRTAAEGAAEEAIVHDLTRLMRLWDDIQKQAKKVKAPSVLYEEPELTLRVFRDLFTDEEFKGLVTDSPSIYDRVMTYVRDIAPDLEPKVSLHQGSLPAFEEHRVEEQIHKALDRKVWLPSGGYLIIERTEAMTIVDVNTGKSVGKTNLEETVVNTNLEAAKEVARQLRLRDIGGIIVVDFIDMLLDKNKGKVEETMKEAMALDKTRSQVFEIGPLGLMQVTRKRVSSGLVESFSETCPTCEGRGILINYES
jgi:ribonuclease E